MRAKKVLSAKINWQQLGKMFEVATPDDIMEQMHLYETIYDDVAMYNKGSYINVLARLPREAQSLLSHRYSSAFMSAIENAFDKADLQLVQNKADISEFTIVPNKDWNTSARAIMNIINGVGYFEFSSLNEFLSSGPYTAREAVLRHLHYIDSYHEVYGGLSVKRQIENNLR